jgi:predicted amidophosphoribosyltransferase
MSDQLPNRREAKTCPACGGVWPPDRRACLACGADLRSVPARPTGAEQGEEPIDWRWLDALAEEGDPAAGPPAPGCERSRPGCLARILPGLG